MDQIVSAETTTVETVALGRPSDSGSDSLFADYGRFRALMYNDVHKIALTPERNEDGTDFDGYDAYAIHLAAIDRVSGDGVISEKIVGAMRIIVDISASVDSPYVTAGLQTELGTLPVETQFPELADSLDLRENRVRCELSRYLATSNSLRQQRKISLALRKAAAWHLDNIGAEFSFAVIENRLARQLEREGVGVVPITDARLLPDYGSVNFGAELDLRKLASQYGFEGFSIAPGKVSVEL